MTPRCFTSPRVVLKTGEMLWLAVRAVLIEKTLRRAVWPVGALSLESWGVMPSSASYDLRFRAFLGVQYLRGFSRNSKEKP